MATMIMMGRFSSNRWRSSCGSDPVGSSSTLVVALANYHRTDTRPRRQAHGTTAVSSLENKLCGCGAESNLLLFCPRYYERQKALRTTRATTAAWFHIICRSIVIMERYIARMCLHNSFRYGALALRR
jgi:hypothetical protein